MTLEAAKLGFFLRVRGWKEIITVDDSGENLLEVLRRFSGGEHSLPTPCVKGLCGKCRVKILRGGNRLSPLTKDEQRLLGFQVQENIRLACQIIPRNDLEISIIDKEYRIDSDFKSQDSTTNFEFFYPRNPRFKRIHVEIGGPTLEDSEDDYNRVKKKFLDLEELSVDFNTLKKFSTTLRDNNWIVDLIFDQKEKRIIDVGSFEDLLGVVFDIGTTSIAGTLVDLETGELLATGNQLNPQIEFGRDIITRLSYVLEHPATRKMQRMVFKGLKLLLTKLTKDSGRNLSEVREIMIVGNTAMHHLFLGLPIGPLSRAPYVAVTTSELSYLAKEIGLDQPLNILPSAQITCLPLIGGFIGSDISADILYTRLHRLQGNNLLMDFGTNSEMLLALDGRIFAASVAAGGAFEGQHISCGMRGIPGAIDRIWIDENTKEIQFTTIDNQDPEGICGSGIVDLFAELLRVNRLDQRGRLFDKEGQSVQELPIESTELYITRKDVESIQKAKAAVHAAIVLLTKKFHIRTVDIDSIQVAGVFGSSLNIPNAQRIGLLPPVHESKISLVGNTAEKGARVALLSLDARSEIKKAIKSIKRQELTNMPEFQHHFTEGLFFPSYPF